jgi:hypothetical protein
MSSYVVEKERFVKAAGILAGIYQATENSVMKLYVYDYQYGHVMGPKDYYNRFCECFLMNALSVQEQYHDETPETDDNKYTEVFADYMQLGKMIMTRYRGKLQEMIFELADFFREVEYQTEKLEYLFKMKMIFGEILSSLTELADSYRSERMKRQTFDIL